MPNKDAKSFSENYPPKQEQIMTLFCPDIIFFHFPNIFATFDPTKRIKLEIILSVF